MNVTENKTNALRAQEHGHQPCIVIEKSTTPPLPVYTLKIRSGCEGGGKGALIQTDKSATLGTSNDQTMFVPLRSNK